MAPDKVGEGTGDAVVPSGGDDVTLDTDTGEILMGSSVIRAAGEGLDESTGIAFSTVAQGSSEPGLGVFSMGSLDVEAGAVLRGVGNNALVLLVGGNVQIDGLVTVATEDDTAGPGGYAGGGGGAVGRIRINATTQTVNGLVSPADSTGAFTLGSLQLTGD